MKKLKNSFEFNKDVDVSDDLRILISKMIISDRKKRIEWTKLY